MIWHNVKEQEPKHLELCLIYLDNHNCFDELGMVQHYIGRYKKDQCNHFDKDGTRIPEYVKSYFDTNGGTTYHIDINKVTRYSIIE